MTDPRNARVPADLAAAHIAQLVEDGATMWKIAKAVGLSHTTIGDIRAGRQHKVTASVEERILAVTVGDARRDGAGGRPVGKVNVKRDGKPQHSTPDWFSDAECWGSTSLMFPAPGLGRGHSADYRPALAICARCPVLDECWAWTVENVPPHEIRESGGVYAGRRPNEAVKEIRAIKQRQKRSAA